MANKQNRPDSERINAVSSSDGNFTGRTVPKEEGVLLKLDSITERKSERGCIVKGWTIDTSGENDIEITLHPFNAAKSVGFRNNKIRTDVAALYSYAKDLPLYTGFEFITDLTYFEIRSITAVNLKTNLRATVRHREFPRVTKDLNPFERFFRTISMSFERLQALIQALGGDSARPA